MSVSDLSTLSISLLSNMIHSGDISSRQLVESCLEMAELRDEKLNSFSFLNPELAIDQAIEMDKLREKGKILSPLHGIPIAVKDNYLVNGMPTTACSKTRKKSVGTRDSVAVSNLKLSGALILGKTNMHEWAYGATNEISMAGRVKNPWNLSKISGGSSGGSAAALAAGLVPAAMGSDTGGSIRIPSSACGVCGLKPTFGQIDAGGVLPLSYSMDVAGPMARSVEDLSLLFDVLELDKTIQLEKTVTPESKFHGVLQGLKIAKIEGERLECSEQVGQSINKALSVFSDHGAKVNSIKLDNMVDGFAAWDTILHVEATTYHSSTLENEADLFSDSVRNHLEAGRYIPATSYLKAQQYRKLFNSLIARIFIKNHIIVMPTLPITAPLAGSDEVSFSEVKVSPQDSMTYLAWFANFTFLPALSIPCGKDDEGMPVGISLIGPAGSDKTLLKLGIEIQRLTKWHKERPAL